VRLHERFGAYTAAVLVVSSLALPTGAYAGPDPPPSTAVAAPAIRIDNFGQVNANYFRGAHPNGRDYADLAALGVKTVINLTSSDADANERTFVEGAGMKYVQIPMTTRDQPKTAELTEFLSIVNDPANQPVYVHCVGGRHRTGVMTAAYRMTHDGWNSDQAFAEMKRYKFGADFLHPEFKQFVYTYRPDSTQPALATASNAPSSKQ
jgi:tyrosine-protein phosphatase SIW14